MVTPAPTLPRSRIARARSAPDGVATSLRYATFEGFSRLRGRVAVGVGAFGRLRLLAGLQLGAVLLDGRGDVPDLFSGRVVGKGALGLEELQAVALPLRRRDDGDAEDRVVAVRDIDQFHDVTPQPAPSHWY